MHDILKGMPEKNLDYKDTTSLQWKKDVIDFFKDKNLDRCLEVGTCWGGTTKILSDLFDEVYTIEYQQRLVDDARDFCKGCDNIQFICDDAYNDKTYSNLPDTFNVVVIDCVHLYDQVVSDIQRALTMYNPITGLYLVFDDNGHPESIGVKDAIDFAIDEGLKVEKYIGEKPGFEVERLNGTKFTLIHDEGVILSYGV
jgi:SAM-dependent methyltransferase